jgi:hypothetical protein
VERVGGTGGVGVMLGLSGSASFLPPGTIIIGLLVGVDLGGTHSGLLCIANPRDWSPENELASGGKSLSNDCSSLLNELSSST